MPGTNAHWALFLDVDGTLLDIAARPEDVEVDPRLAGDLARVRARLDGAVALLSGRPLAQLDDLFDWHGHAAAGLHGAELRMPDGKEHCTGDVERFARVRAQAASLVAALPGVRVEDKGRALALHFRQVPAARPAVQRIAELLLEETGGGYALQHGDQVIELKPAGADKGRALATLMDALPFHGRRPWVLGDDLTDEDAFRRANAMDGVSVVVGVRRPTAARHALASPAAARGWLHALVPAEVA